MKANVWAPARATPHSFYISSSLCTPHASCAWPELCTSQYLYQEVCSNQKWQDLSERSPLDLPWCTFIKSMKVAVHSSKLYRFCQAAICVMLGSAGQVFHYVVIFGIEICKYALWMRLWTAFSLVLLPSALLLVWRAFVPVLSWNIYWLTLKLWVGRII